MEDAKKSQAFANELMLIVNPNIRECAEWCLNQLPDYFYEVAASSSGKYHPKYALGDGGLVRHTIAAVRIAHTLLYTDTFGEGFTSGQKDAILMALLIHDGLKHGNPKQRYTVKNHPMLIRPYFDKLIADSISVTDIEFYLTKSQMNAIYGLVESHMGQWNNADGEMMPKPCNLPQKFVHLCDYLASRKSIDFNFEA